MITQEQKTNWLDGLRSGKYIQGRGSLERDEKYCCLGVLCKTIGIKFQGDACIDDKGNSLGYGPIDDLIFHGNHLTLVGMNDEEDADFNEIANWIEENIKPEN